MRELNVYLEIEGKPVLVGCISGNSFVDAFFCYAKEYISRPDSRAISVNLPLNEEKFSPAQTRTFFEGLLPEGFSRRAVANWAKVNEEDYLAILARLGRECLGALLILEKGETWQEGEYQKLSDREVAALAAEGASRSTEILMETHLSLTGASGKVGLYYDENKKTWYLPTGKLASSHIVKQSHVRLERIVLNEYFCILLAKKLGIEVPDTFVINNGNGRDDEVLFATKRYDRKIVAEAASPYRLHQEDFSQAQGIPAAEKYEQYDSGYMRKMFEIVRRFSSNPIEDQLKLWDIIVVNFLIGNTDCHIKNYSLLYSEDLKTVRLAPAYDIVCTVIYQTTRKMSFYIGGEIDIDKIDREAFIKAATDIGLGVKIAMNHFDRLVSIFEGAVNEVAMEMHAMGYDADDIRDAMINRKRTIKWN